MKGEASGCRRQAGPSQSPQVQMDFLVESTGFLVADEEGARPGGLLSL